MTGGTITAARLALDGRDRVAVHIGGGFHHAFANHGEGFCLFNDVAVAIRECAARRAARCARRSSISTSTTATARRRSSTATRASSRCRCTSRTTIREVKPRGSLDIGLARRHRRRRLSRLPRRRADPRARAPARVVFYLAGADPYGDDQLGGLALSRAGLRRRDRLVFEAARSAGVPIVVLLAGGYARHLDDTVAIHAATVEEAARA